MPQRKSGIKALRQNQRRRMQNLDAQTDLKKTVKKFMKSVESKNKDEARANLKLVYKKLDKAAKTGRLLKNTVARRKSRFSKLAANIA